MAGANRADARWGVLGGAWASVGDRPVALGRQSRFVLALLLQRPGRPVPIDRITAGHGLASERAVAAARMAVSRLRTQLAVAGMDRHLDTTPSGYVIDVDPLTVDHIAFEQRVREADSTEWPDAALRRLDAALELWRGDPFGDLGDDEPFHTDARALAELHRRCVDTWGELVLRAGRHRESLSRLEAAAIEEPLRERRWESLVLAHYRSGNQSQALRAYEQARTVLREQVGLEPGVELKRLAARVLDQDPGLDWRPERQRARAEALRPLSRASVVIGRDREIADLVSLLERHRVVTIGGLGGIGKSSVAGEVARRADRPVWVAALADVHDPALVVRCVASALGLAVEATDDELVAAIADHLEPSGLLVLDNCEHVLAKVEELVDALIVLAPGARILATSRTELSARGAMSYVLPPLDVGGPSEPGPAALIAADFALIPPSQVADRWDEIAAICRHADGVPLALELLGAAAATGAADLDVRDPVATAVTTALASLPTEAREVVLALAALPGDTSARLLGRVVDCDELGLRRALGYAVRAGLVVHRAAGDTSRVRVLEPARDVLATDGTVGDVVDGVHRAVSELVRAARPSMIEPIVEDVALLLDDEHGTVTWLLDRLAPPEQFDLVVDIAAMWRAAGRTSDGLAWLRAIEAGVPTAPRLRQACYWVARARMAPSLSSRLPFVEQLRWAKAVADEEGALDVAGRAGAELAIALGLGGDLPGALAVLDELDQRTPTGNHWASLGIAGLRALARGASGDPRGAATDLLDVVRAFATLGTTSEAMSHAYLAVSLAQIAGDDDLVRDAIELAEALPVDRFSAHAHASMRFEHARYALRHGDPASGRLLWEALGALSERGEHRATEVCRRELGRWRLARGDRGGVSDLARSARTLARHDPAASAVAVAALLTEATLELGTDDVELLGGAVPELLAAPGGVPLSDADRAVVARVGTGGVQVELAAAIELLHHIERVELGAA